MKDKVVYGILCEEGDYSRCTSEMLLVCTEKDKAEVFRQLYEEKEKATGKKYDLATYSIKEIPLDPVELPEESE